MAVKTFTAGEVLTTSDTNTYLANSGLVYVGAGTLSLTTSASNVTGVFSSTYKQYRVILNITTRSTSNRVDWKFIVGTTPTSVNYFCAGIGANFASNTTEYAQRSYNDAQWYGQAGSVQGSVIVDIVNANKAARTLWTGNIFDSDSGLGYAIAGNQLSATAFTGFQLFTSTGTATVEYQVFGYRDA